MTADAGPDTTLVHRANDRLYKPNRLDPFFEAGTQDSRYVTGVRGGYLHCRRLSGFGRNQSCVREDLHERLCRRLATQARFLLQLDERKRLPIVISFGFSLSPSSMPKIGPHTP
jgi:hypothetical protein